MSRARDVIARFVPRGAAILSVLLFGSYLMGLLRDRVFARTFGASAELDAYNAAFQLPESSSTCWSRLAWRRPSSRSSCA